MYDQIIWSASKILKSIVKRKNQTNQKNNKCSKFEFQSLKFDIAADQMNDTQKTSRFQKHTVKGSLLTSSGWVLMVAYHKLFPFFSFFLSNFKQKINIIIRKLFEFSTVDFSKFEFCSVIIMIVDFYKKRTLKYGEERH